MILLLLESLPPQTTKGTLVRLLAQVGGIDRARIGAIEVAGRRATIEVPEAWRDRLIKALDGATLGNQHVRARAERAVVGGGGLDHLAHLARLLALEAAAEAEQVQRSARRLSPAEAERRGTCLSGLVVRDHTMGLGGRFLVTLAKRTMGKPLPWSRLGVGSPVLLSSASSADGPARRGVISDRSASDVEVAFDQFPDELLELRDLRLDLSADEIARQRQVHALDRAQAASGDRLAVLRRVLLGEQEPLFAGEAAIEPYDPALNDSQRAAIEFALAARDVAVLHGPPGTGKTTTVVELIRQAVRRGERVLACAPSNLGVDNLLERLLAAGLSAVRLGHPARVLPELRAATLDTRVDEHADVRLARKLVREANQLRARAGSWRRARPVPGERQEMKDEARRLVADARRLEAQVVAQVLDKAPVVCSTLTGIDAEILGQRHFDLVVIDEACQSTEPSSWIPLSRAARLVLAGDHCQLPPTVVSPDAARGGLNVSLLERMVQRWGSTIARRLEVQYRMHASIMQFSSSEFYESSLIAAPDVADQRLCDLGHVAPEPATETVLEFVDTAGASFDEETEEDGESRRNPGEARWVRARLEALLAAGLRPAEIACITPYAAQVRLLREQCDVPGLDIDTVDGFQGREKEAVIISLVRSNPRGEIGFLGDVRRMNVALTRARRRLVVIGDSGTIAGHPFYVRLLEYFERQGAYHTVWEEPEFLG